MKLVYDEGEKERIHELLENKPIIFTNDDKISEKLFSMEFIVTDPALADYTLLGLLNNKLDINLGIEIKSINFNKPNEFLKIDKEELKMKLNKFIDEL